MSSKTPRSYSFEGYRLDTQPPGLWRDLELISVPPKVLKMLILLVEKRGGIVTREELLDEVWPETHVEEGNIKYTISLLRKTLGKDLVQTVPRQGYRFVARFEDIPSNGLGRSAVEDQSPQEPDKAGLISAPGQAAPLVPAKPKLSRSLLIALGALVLSTVAAGLWWRSHTEPVAANTRQIKSIAILPLKTQNDDESSKALSFGVTESLISRLGSLNRFTVRPLDAVEPYAKGGRDAVKSGGELKVDAVMEGTLQIVNGRLRVIVRLIDVRDGSQIWMANFDETENDIFKLQDKLAAQVANSLVIRITREEQSLLAGKQPENVDAFRACARGRAILDRRDFDRFDNAINEFQNALSLDAAFAPAYAGLANAFMMKGNMLSGDEANDSFVRSERYAEKALELGKESSEIHLVLARIKRTVDWDWASAEREFKRAIQLNPNSAEAHRYYGQMLSFLGRHDEAKMEIRQALEINPISPAITQAQFSVLEGRGEYAEALKLAEEFYRYDKENSGAKRAVSTFLFHLGNYPKVIEISEHLTAKDERQRFAFLSLLAASYTKTNQPEKAEETLRELEQLAQSDTKALYSLALNYAELGRADDAMWALNKCLDLREERLVWLKVEPRLAKLRNDSRFQELARKLNLNGA